MKNILPVLLFMVCLALLACEHEMYNNSRYKPLETHKFFKNQQIAQPLVPGTVARGYLQDDELLETGRINGELADVFPFPVTREILERGQERFNIYCSVCHDQAGYGKGMVVQRGFPIAASYHTDTLREKPVGHFVDVMLNGFGNMPSYSYQVRAKDRWAIAAYIRALQLSQNADFADTQDETRKILENARGK